MFALATTYSGKADFNQADTFGDDELMVACPAHLRNELKSLQDALDEIAECIIY